MVETPPDLIADSMTMARALSDLQDPIAVDSEFHAEYRYRPKLMLIQIRDVAGRELLIDAAAMRDLRPLGAALSGRQLLLHAASSDVPLLVARAGLAPPGPGTVTDTQVLAGFAGLGYPQNLGSLLEAVLGVTPSVSFGLSNWEQRPLMPEQLKYALEDVQHLHALSAALQERAGEERAALAQEAALELVERQLAEPVVDELWKSIPASEVLNARGRGILQRLVAWREQEARSTDRPTYQIVSNAALVDVSRRQPRSHDALMMNRKTPRGVAKRHGEFLVRVVREVWEIPESELPISVTTTPWGRATDRLLDAWAHAVELQEGVAARLLMPKWLKQELVASLAREEPLALTGWRRPWAENLRNVLSGERVLRTGAEGPRVEKVD